MDIEDTIPPSYKPLPPICSEAAHKYKWPTIQTKESYVPEEIKTSLFGPTKSSLPEPSLRYHRQSTYTDAFGEVKPFHIRGYSLQSDWLNPVGKRGNFYGVSSYENDYIWPDKSSSMPRIPMVSTISWGILPLLGTSSDTKEISPKKKVKDNEKKLERSFDKKKDDPEMKKKFLSKDFVPLQDIWSGETIYRRDYLIPPEGWRTKPAKKPVPELKFSGNIETTTTAMRDYQDPRNVKHEDYFEKYYDEDRNNMESRFPFFLF